MTDPDRQTLTTLAILLRQGNRIDRLSRPLTLGALLLLMAHGPLGLTLSPAFLILIAALGLAEAWFAARIGLDAALFADLARPESGANLTGLDAALTNLGLLPRAKAGRPLGPRAKGAMRLLQYQMAALLGQIALVFMPVLI